MLLRIALTTACLLLAAPAFGASQKDHDDCNSDDVARAVAGCTQVIGDTSEKAEIRATAHVRRGLALVEQGKLDEAMRDFDAAIGLDPKDALAYNNRAFLWHEKNELDRAIADLTEAIRIDPMPRMKAGPVNLHFNRAMILLQKKEYDRAIADFDRAIALDAKDAQAFYWRGRVHFLLRKFDRAVSDMTEAARLDPTDEQIAGDLKLLLDPAKEALEVALLQRQAGKANLRELPSIDHHPALGQPPTG
jgi:tetratricopeptide (TPR) repeat protein